MRFAVETSIRETERKNDALVANTSTWAHINPGKLSQRDRKSIHSRRTGKLSVAIAHIYTRSLLLRRVHARRDPNSLRWDAPSPPPATSSAFPIN